MGNLQATEVSNPITPQAQPLSTTVTSTAPADLLKFPYKNSLPRLNDYEYFNHLLMGEHFEAFNVKINSEDYTKNYARLRYVAVNFAGLVSKISADMLFSEPIMIKTGDDGDQEFIDAVMTDNRMNEQLYESAIGNSALGDCLFKIRAGKRNPNDDEATLIIEEFTPTIFFPEINGFNVRSTPKCVELSWTFLIGQQKYLRKEIHYIGRIENEVWLMQDEKITGRGDLSVLGDPDLKDVQETGIDRYLIVHIPNWKTGSRYFGISDYYDLDKIFYAINNRISKVDNILDKHSDPILAVPSGVLDDKGKVKKEAFNMFEVPEGLEGTMKPEYIVWNANLESAFSQIDKLLDFMMMTAEMTPDILGMGQGMNDSGRALKFKLMRTIAKSLRKKLYYDRGIKELLYTAQVFAKQWGLKVGKDKIELNGEPTEVDIIWQDGLPIDDYEQVDTEIKKIDAGLQSKLEAIQNLDNLDEEAAEEKLDTIEEEQKTALPTMDMNIANFGDNGSADGSQPVKPDPVMAKTPPVSAPKALPPKQKKK